MKRDGHISKLCGGIVNVLYWCVVVVVCVVVAYYCVRIFVADQFVIPTSSMEPTLCPGDRVIVNKLHMGARIYTDFNFSKEGQRLESMRLKGLRPLRHNDVVVFNFPVIDDTISFKINFVFCKRIIGLPGDSISIRGGHYRNSNFRGVLGVKEMQERVAELPDTVEGYPGFNCAPWGSGRTMKEFAPLYIPRKGDLVEVDSVFTAHYPRELRYEIGKEVTWDSAAGVAMAGGKPLLRHRFTHNYYFMAGDNAPDSSDSRYWGLVPEEHIVGVVDLISYSINKRTGKTEWGRFMRNI